MPRHRRLATDIGEMQIAAPQPAGSDLELLEDLVLEHGATPTPEFLQALDATIEDLAISRAAEFIRHVLQRLKNTSAAEALRRVVLGDSEPLSLAAGRAGVSKVAIHRAAKRIRTKLEPPATT